MVGSENEKELVHILYKSETHSLIVLKVELSIVGTSHMLFLHNVHFVYF